MSTQTLAPPGGPARPGPERVPVDERVAGFDRRSFWPGIVLLVVYVLWAHVMPWINSQVDLDDPIVAGDVINLGLGEVTFLPAEGWNLEAGLRLTEGAEERVNVPSTTLLSSDVLSYSVATGNWEGDADALLDRMLDVNESLDNLLVKDEEGRVSIANADGVSGRLVYVNGIDEDVLIAAFVFPKVDGSDEGDTADAGSTQPAIGVEIEVRGQTDDMEEELEAIATMIASTTYRPTAEEANA